MNNYQIAEAMSRNGYIVIPCPPGRKKTYCLWGEVTKENYSFEKLFAESRWNTNTAILTEDIVAVVDYDNHGPEPNGLTLYRWLWKTHPELFEGCIIEKTTSGGFHVYYRGVAGNTYKADVACWHMDPYIEPITYLGIALQYNAEATVKVEVLCGRRICYCWPSLVSDRGPYKAITGEDFLNTPPSELPALPGVFNRPPEPVREEYVIEEKLSQEDLEVAVQYYLDKRDYAGAGAHDQARPMARCLAGLGLSVHEIERHVEGYIRRHGNDGHGRDLTDKNEAKRIADYGKKHPFEAIPITAIKEARARRGDDKIGAIRRNMKRGETA